MSSYFYTVVFYDDTEINISSENPINVGDYISLDGIYFLVVSLSNEIEKTHDVYRVKTTHLYVQEDN